MNIVRLLSLVALIVVCANLGQAQDAPAAASSTIYVGGGVSNSSDPYADDSMPFAIGLYFQGPTTKSLVGFDLAGEGTSIDSTYLMNEQPVQAMSINFLFGQNLADDGHWKVDAALLAGIRNTAADCPDSYLGYACYADTEPTVEYAVNYGAVVTVSYNKALLGLRVTGESAQVLAGLRF